MDLKKARFPHLRNFYFKEIKHWSSLAAKRSLPSLLFAVLSKKLENSLPKESILWREKIITNGILDGALNCLKIFSHNDCDLNDNLKAKSNKLEISTNNDEELNLIKKYEMNQILAILRIITQFIAVNNAGMKHNLCSETKFRISTKLLDLLKKSFLIPFIRNYLNNISIFFISENPKVFVEICDLLIEMSKSQELSILVYTKDESNSETLKVLLESTNDVLQQYSSNLKKLKSSKINNIEDPNMKRLIDKMKITVMTINVNNLQKCDAEKKDQPKNLQEMYLDVMKPLRVCSYKMIDDNNLFTVPFQFNHALNSSECNKDYKRIVREVETLITSLPLSYNSSIFICQDLDRMDILKCLITGPSNTPYANGCFEFDVYYPTNYPNEPVKMAYKTVTNGYNKINPNLYNNGDVCLSLLNTWNGPPDSRWNPNKSTLMEVLIAIQSTVFVRDPFYNEPNYESLRGTVIGDLRCTMYTNKTYIQTVCEAIIKQIRNPSPCFKDVIFTHFWLKRNEICEQVKNWIKDVKKPEFNNILKMNYSEMYDLLSTLPVPKDLNNFDNPIVAKDNFII